MASLSQPKPLTVTKKHPDPANANPAGVVLIYVGDQHHLRLIK